MKPTPTHKTNSVDHYGRRITDTNGLLKHWDHPFSKALLEKWRHTGDGPPFFKIGRAVRYDLDAADRWLDEHMRDSVSPVARSKQDSYLQTKYKPEMRAENGRRPRAAAKRSQ